MDGHCARLLRLPDFLSVQSVVPSCGSALSDSRLTCVTTLMAQEQNCCQSFIRHGSGACVTESMSVLTDPATYGLLHSELTNCPHAQKQYWENWQLNGNR